jgi:hypothetical protein
VGSRYAIFVALAVLCSGRLAIPQVLGTELAGCAAAEVVGGKEPAVQVTDSEGKVLASIPVGLNPGAHAYSKSTNTLYVVHDYKKLEHHISAVNLTTRRVDKEIEVGAGEVDLHLSSDGRRLFCYTAGSGDIFADRPTGRSLKPAITVIDTASNEVVSTYDWLDSFRARMRREGRNTFLPALRFLADTDRGDLVVRYLALKNRWASTPAEDQILVFGGEPSHMVLMTGTGGRLVAQTLSHDRRFYFAAAAGDDLTDGSLVAIDLEKGILARRVGLGGRVVACMFSRDGKLFYAALGGNKHTAASLAAVDLETGAVVRRPDIGMRMVAWLFSPDQKYFFAALEGSKPANGSLAVVDLEKGAIANHDLDDRPTGFLLLGSRREPWLVGSQEMRALLENGEPANRRVQLRDPYAPESGGGRGGPYLGGFPRESIAVGEDRVAIVTNGGDGLANHKVALLELSKPKVEAIISTTTFAHEAKVVTGRALEAAVAAAALATLTAIVGVDITDNPYSQGELLVAGPDGRFLYAMDPDSHKVVVVDLQSAKLVRRISVDGPIFGIRLSCDGKHLICVGKRIQRINLETNELEN